MKTYAKISGIAYVIIFITGFYANFAILSSLIEIDNPSKTLTNKSLTKNFHTLTCIYKVAKFLW